MPTPKCDQHWHPEARMSPKCCEDEGHELPHKGYNMIWLKSPAVDKETAEKFLSYYRRIPNGQHEIYLQDDGTVHMTLRGLWAATAFLGVMPSSD